MQDDFFSEFFAQGENHKEKQANESQIEERLSKRRLGRITASQFFRVKLKEEKADGYSKANIIDWIQSQKQGLFLLGELADKHGKDSYEKLTFEQIKELYNQMPGKLKLTKGAETYIDELIDELLVGHSKYEFFSVSTQWGKEKEAESLDLFEQRMKEQHPTWIFKRGEFFIHPESNLIGATPDMTIYDSEKSLEIPIAVVENKAPFVGANHVSVMRSKCYDEQYEEQIFGQIICANVPVCYFVSYNPRIVNDELKQIVVPVYRKEFKEQIDDLNFRLLKFASIYQKEAKKLGINLNDFLL